MIKRFLAFLLPFLAFAHVAFAVPLCTITGTVTDGAGNPVANGVITFNTLLTQVVSGNTINQTLVSTTTDASGNLAPISLAQGVYLQVTVNGGVPVTAIVPFASTSTFSALISNIVANPTTSFVIFTGGSAPTCTSGSGTIYFDSVTNRLRLDNNCGGYSNFVTAASTDTLTNKTLDQGTLVNMGTGTAAMGTCGRLNAQTPNVGNGADTTEDTLVTYTLPANTLSANNKYIEIDAFGQTASNADSKRLRLYWGLSGTALLDYTAFNSSSNQWHIRAKIMRRTTSQQNYSTSIQDGKGAGADQMNSSGAGRNEDETTALALKITGQNSSTATANSLTVTGFTVQGCN